jgi:protein farnesyltransferase subunit beta
VPAFTHSREAERVRVSKLGLHAGPDVVRFLGGCQDADGGFGGSPGQLPHLAPTYAAVATLLSMGGEAALRAIDRRGVLNFIGSMCVPPGAGGGLSVCQGEPAICG